MPPNETNPVLHLPEMQVMDIEEHVPEPHTSAELVPALPQKADISQLNTSEGLAKMAVGMRLAYAEQLIKSGLVPKHFNTPDKALLAFEQGEVLGLRPIEALARLYVIDGKVSMYAELVLSLATRAGIDIDWLDDKTDVIGPFCNEQGQITGEGVVDWKWQIELTYLWKGKQKVKKMTLLWSECIEAGWTSKEPWKKHKRAMARARLSVMAIRAFRPDVLMGHHTLDELIDSDRANTHAYDVSDSGNPIPLN